MGEIRKFIMGVVGAVIYSIYAAITDGVISAPEWAGIGTVALGAVFMWRAPNTLAWNTAKTWVYALGTGSVLLQTVIVGGLDNREILELVILVGSTAGVYIVPNKDVFRPAGQPTAS